MSQSIHGHEVMRRMIDSGQIYTKESLRSAIRAWFGETAQFYTCSANGLTAEELIAFLSSRSKFYSEGIGFRVNEDEICDEA